MSTDLPTQRPSDDCSPEYVAAIEQALAAVYEPHTHTPAPPAPHRPTRRGHHRTMWTAAWRGARSGLLYVAALAALVVLGGQIAAVLVDWFAPSAGRSACSEVALPLVVAVGLLAVVGLAGAAVREIGRTRRRT